MNSDYKNADHFKERCGYDINGVWYPRVTKIVDVKSKPALYYFYGKFGYNRAQEISNKSAEEGTIVHQAIESLLTNKKVGNIPAYMAPSVYAFIDFFKKTNIKVDKDHVEKRVFDTENLYAGTLDLIAEIDGKQGVLDIKTSGAIYRDYDLQTSAYFNALTKDFPNLQTRWILRIDQNQTCKKCKATLRIKGGRNKTKKNSKDLCSFGNHEWEEAKGIIELKEIKTPWQEDFQAFLGAKKLWEWEYKNWLEKIGYL